ncbi:TPA_asm: UL5.6 [Human alphaherpesvirus 1]|nr:TPA_asm: UL5.6 [Human alphaherpesvirus 1]
MCSSVMGRPYSSTFMRLPNSCSTHRLLLIKMAQLYERRAYSRSVRLQMRYVSTFSLWRTEHRSFWCSKVDSRDAVCVGEPTHTNTGRRRAAYWGVWYRALIIHQQYTTAVRR